MAQRYTETVKMPGTPKSYVERPRRRPKVVRQPEPPSTVEPAVRARLAWSRAIIDQNRGAATVDAASIPPVRSMAALRARAGTSENTYAPLPLEPLLATAAVEARRPVAREIYRPALEPVPMPAPPPSLGQRLKAWINGILD